MEYLIVIACRLCHGQQNPVNERPAPESRLAIPFPGRLGSDVCGSAALTAAKLAEIINNATWPDRMLLFV